MPKNYEDMSKEDLAKLASKRDIEGRSGMNKDELIAALSKAEDVTTHDVADGERTGWS